MKKLIIISLLLLPLFAMAATPKPTCDVGFYEGTYDSVTDTWTGECVILGGNHLSLLPKIRIDEPFGNTISWLNSHFMSSRVVIGSNSNPFAISEYGTPYYGNHLTAMLNPLQGTDYGYDMSIGGYEGVQTAGYMDLNLPSGTYYARVVSDYMGFREIVSPEIMIEL